MFNFYSKQEVILFIHKDITYNIERIKSIVTSLEATIKVTDGNMHILETVYSYLVSLSSFMVEVLIYKSITLHTKIIQSLMELDDFFWL